MTIDILYGFVPAEEQPFEIIERKGFGHPDTMADTLAEELSIAYSRYCLSHFGAILRHQFDKLTLMCGRSEVAFGGGRITSPIRILINGRASPRLGAEQIPLNDIFLRTVQGYFAAHFPMLNVEKDLRFLIETNHSTTGGIRGEGQANEAAIHYRFNPRTLADLPETVLREANDTSMGCAYAPFSPLENLVKELEAWLNGDAFKTQRPWMGSDIKIMAYRNGKRVALTIAAPLLSGLITSFEHYSQCLSVVEREIREFARVRYAVTDLSLTLNAGDDIHIRKLYMNWTGSSIESGDEGQVGRGNRLGGVIAPLRPFTMEGISGKNPVYHAGKVYSAAAFDIASRLYSEFNIPVEVYLLSQMARPLHDPWKLLVRFARGAVPENAISAIATEVLNDFPAITNRLLEGKYVIC